MDELPFEKCLLITCEALQPFTDKKLLAKDPDGNKITAKGVGKFPIIKLLKDVKKDDEDEGLHQIDAILDALVQGCDEEGFNLAISEVELLDETLAFNVKSLALLLNANATPKP